MFNGFLVHRSSATIESDIESATQSSDKCRGSSEKLTWRRSTDPS